MAFPSDLDNLPTNHAVGDAGLTAAINALAAAVNAVEAYAGVSGSGVATSLAYKVASNATALANKLGATAPVPYVAANGAAAGALVSWMGTNYLALQNAPGGTAASNAAFFAPFGAAGKSARNARLRVVANRGNWCNDTTYPNQITSAGAGAFTPTLDRGAYSGANSYAVGDYTAQNGFTYTPKAALAAGVAPPTTATSDANWQFVLTQASYATVFTAAGACKNIRAYYTPGTVGGSTSHTPGPSDLAEFRASVGPLSVYHYAFPFQGTSLPRAFSDLSGPVGLSFLAGDTIPVRTFIRVAPGGRWIYNRRFGAAFPSDLTNDPTQSAAGNGSDATLGVGTIGSPTNFTSSYQFGPLYLVGEYVGNPVPTLAVAGDSIPMGFGTADGRSWIVRAFQAAGWNTYLIGSAGSTALVNRRFGDVYNLMAEFCDYVGLHHLTNDLVGAATDVDVLYGYLVQEAVSLSCGGRRPVIVGTVLPRVGTTDSYATAGNQTPMGDRITAMADNGSGLVRVTLAGNTQFQTGDVVRPLVNGTGSYAAVSGGAYTATRISSTVYDLQGTASGGTFASGALGNVTREGFRTTINDRIRNGTFAAACAALGTQVYVVDPCSVAEVNAAGALATNGGRIVANGTANAYTSDGVHPTNLLTDLMATCIVPATYPLYE